MKVPKLIIGEVLSEMNSLALSLDNTEPFLKWAIMTLPRVVPCDHVALALVRYDTVLLNGGCARPDPTDTLDRYKGLIEDFAKREALPMTEIWQMGEMHQIEDVIEDETNKPSPDIKYHKVVKLEARGGLVGYLLAGRSWEKDFLKYELNILETLCEQASLGLRCLLDRGLIIEQARLVDEEKRTIETIVKGMKEGLILSDRYKHVISINDAATELLGIKDIPDDRFGKRYIVQKLLGTDIEKGAFERDICLTRPRPKVIHLTGAPIFSAENEFIGSSTLLTDVTKAREVEQMKSDFVSAVSHELRTPLTSMREAISLMVDEIVGNVNEKQKRCLTVALQNTDRLTRLINDLLNLSKIEAGKLKMKRTSLVVQQVVEHVFAIFQVPAKNNGVTLVSDLPDGLPSLFADPDQMIQVLTNLVGNAMKFTPKGGRITVGARVCHPHGACHPRSDCHPRESGDLLRSRDSRLRGNDSDKQFVEISVHDTGPGISKEDQERLFKKFSQLDTGLTRHPGGTGLGLAISKELVIKHGGKIWVTSKTGDGSTFSFTVPAFTVDSAYLDLVEHEVARVREAGTFLSLIFIDPKFGKELKLEDKKALVTLEENIKESLRKKSDLALIYDNRYLLAVIEANREGAESIMTRARELFKRGFEYKIVVYPDDGINVEELLKRVKGDV